MNLGKTEVLIAVALTIHLLIVNRSIKNIELLRDNFTNIYIAIASFMVINTGIFTVPLGGEPIQAFAIITIGIMFLAKYLKVENIN